MFELKIKIKFWDFFRASESIFKGKIDFFPTNLEAYTKFTICLMQIFKITDH